METIFLKGDNIKVVLSIENKHKLKNLVSFDPVSEEQRTKAEKEGIKLITWEELRLEGKKYIQ